MGAKKMSLHQTGFQDVIATAQLMGCCPERLCLIGVQPEELEDYGGGLRDIVAAQIDPAVDIGIEKLASGVSPPAKAAAPPTTSPMSRHPPRRLRGRPPQREEAYRHGRRALRARTEG
jgi:hydrogenase maturation protease